MLGAFVASAGMCAISALSYPGGVALERLHDIGRRGNETGIKVVHMDTLTCMTGVTRFGQQKAPEVEGEEVLWVYDKTEEVGTLLEPQFWDTIDYALAEKPETVLGDWDAVDVVRGFAGFKAVRHNDDRRRRGVVTDMFKDVKRSLAERRFRISYDDELFVIMGALYEEVVYHVKRYVTKGWWVEMKMEPKIQILRRAATAVEEPEPEPVPEAEVVDSSYLEEEEEAAAAEDEGTEAQPVASIDVDHKV